MQRLYRLSAKSVEKIKTPGMFSDGGGLYLAVKEIDGYLGKSWLFRYRGFDGKDHYMGLGSAAVVSLAEARDRAKEARDLRYRGVDPLEARRAARDRTRAESRERLTFREAAERFLEVHLGTWKNPKHRAQWRSTLEQYAYRPLGSRPVSAIDAAVINEALAPIWTKVPVTAKRTRQRIERVVGWVKAGMPLPRHRASKQVKHHPAMPFDELPAFMSELRERTGISARALEFTILTAARTSEAIGAKWSEIDLDAKVWTVPAERMKAGKEHQVPLSERAMEILKSLPREKGSPYVFPGARAKQPLSNMAMLELLRGMRGDGLTVHGFRSTFRDWAGDRTNFPRDVIEHALAHRIKDKAEASYRRSSALEKRRRLMQAWADYCAAPPAEGKVLAIGGAHG